MRGIVYENEENAVVEYLNATDIDEKNRIFAESLYPAFTKMIESTIEENVSSYLNGDDRTLWDFVGLREAYKGLLTSSDDFEYSDKELKKVKPDDIASMLCDRAMEIYKGKEELFGTEKFREIERAILLQNVDSNFLLIRKFH